MDKFSFRELEVDYIYSKISHSAEIIYLINLQMGFFETQGGSKYLKTGLCLT